MKLQDVLNLLPGDSVMVTPKTREMGGQYTRSLISALADNKPYRVDKVDKFTHKDEKLDKVIVDRANIYIKGFAGSRFAGSRFDPASFERVKEK